MPLVLHITLQEFDKWAVDFVGPINPLGKRTGAQYIITMTDYLTRWAKAVLVKDCTTTTATKFLYDNVVIRFGCLNILISDQGTHFVNKLIEKLTEEL